VTLVFDLLSNILSRHHGLVDRYEISISQMTMDLLFYVDFVFPRSVPRLYETSLYMWVTRRVSYKEQELPTLREHLGSPTVFSRVIFLVFCVVFCFVCFRFVSCVVTSAWRFSWYTDLLHIFLRNNSQSDIWLFDQYIFSCSFRFASTTWSASGE